MTSVRQGHQRRGAPPALSSHSKPVTISLEEWEAKAPLGDLEIKSIDALKVASENIPLPLKVWYLSFCLPIILERLVSSSTLVKQLLSVRTHQLDANDPIQVLVLRHPVQVRQDCWLPMNYTQSNLCKHRSNSMTGFR
jgi:hypothetical protein